MSDMIEIVARAMHSGRVDSEALAWEDMPPEYRERSMAMVRLGVAAMREPTTIMVSAGQESVYTGGASPGPVHIPMTTASFAAIYQAMIDQALSIPKPKETP